MEGFKIMPLLPGDEHREPHIDTHKISFRTEPVLNDILDRLDKLEKNVDHIMGNYVHDQQTIDEIQSVLSKLETGG
jgi:hypothetical protein